MTKITAPVAVLIISLTAIIIAALVILTLFGYDAAKFVTTIGTLIGLLVAAGILGHQNAKVNEKVDKVGTSVNGNTTALIEALRKYQERDASVLATATATGSLPAVPVVEDAIGEDTLTRIQANAAALPKHRAES